MGYEQQRFQPDKLLNFSKCLAPRGEGLALADDDVVNLAWKIPVGAVEECKAWLRANPSASNFDAGFRRFAGPWRISKITTQDSPGDGPDLVQIVVAYSKGYYTAIDWATARRITKKLAVGNTSEVTGVSNTKSDAPEDWLEVLFPYIASGSADALAASLASGGDVSGKTISDGSTLTGPYHVIAARVERQVDGDGSANIVLTIGQPQFTIQSYTDYLTDRQGDVYYLWDVPKGFVQTIVDAWKVDVGSSATVEYNTDRSTCSVMLRKRASGGINYTSPWMQQTCDSYTRYRLMWGLTKAEVETQLALSANTTLPFEGTTSSAGQTRRIRIDSRGDGLYDVVIEERHIIYDADKHLVSVTAAIGLAGLVAAESVETNYGWHLSKTVLAATQAEYATPEKNKHKTFELKREDDCTFDFVGTIRTFAEQDVTISVSGDNGRALEVARKDFVGKETVEAEAGLVDGTRYQYNIQRTPLGTYVLEKVAQTDPKEEQGYGEEFIRMLVGKNVPLEDIPAPNSQDGYTLSGSDINPTGLNTADYRLQFLRDNDEVEVLGNGNNGRAVTINRYDNIDEAYAALTTNLADGTRYSFNISKTPHGKYVLERLAQTDPLEETAYNEGGFSTVLVGRNATALPTPPANYDFVGGTISPTGTNTFDYSLNFALAAGLSKEYTSKTRSVYIGSNVSYDTAEALISGISGDILQMSFNVTRDGRVDYRIMVKNGTVDEEVTDCVKTVLLVEGTAPTVEDDEELLSASISPDEMGNIYYSVAKRVFPQISTQVGDGALEYNIGVNVNKATLESFIATLEKGLGESEGRRLAGCSITPGDKDRWNYVIVVKQVLNKWREFSGNDFTGDITHGVGTMLSAYEAAAYGKKPVTAPAHSTFSVSARINEYNLYDLVTTLKVFSADNLDEHISASSSVEQKRLVRGAVRDGKQYWHPQKRTITTAITTTFHLGEAPDATSSANKRENVTLFSDFIWRKDSETITFGKWIPDGAVWLQELPNSGEPPSESIPTPDDS